MTPSSRKIAVIRALSDIAPKVQAALASGAATVALWGTVAALWPTFHAPTILVSGTTLVTTAGAAYLKASTIPDLKAWLKARQAADPVGYAAADSVRSQIVAAAAEDLAQFTADVARQVPPYLVPIIVAGGPESAPAAIKAYQVQEAEYARQQAAIRATLPTTPGSAPSAS